MKTNNIYITLIVISVSVINLFSQTTATKTAYYRHKQTPKTELIINNNLGNINIVNSKSDSIIVEVRISSKATNEKKATNLLGKASINEAIKDNYITITTKLENVKENEDLHIDYIVRVPINTRLFIANKHGNIYFGDYKGKVNINLNYGKFVAENLIFTESTPLSKLNFKYCDVNIDNCNWAEINSSYTNLNITNSKSLIINSDYSIVKLEQNTVLKIKSTKDIYKINSISKISGTTKNTSTYAKNVTTSINITGDKGYFKTNYISKYFDSINIEYINGDVSLLIDEDASYNIKAEVFDGKLSIDNTYDADNIKGSNSKLVEGLIGTDSKTKKKVTVKVTNGGLEF